MLIVLANVSLAFIFGFGLAIYLFFSRLNVGKAVRWAGGITVGCILGAVMAVIDFWIIWPPASVLFTIIGFALMVLIAALIIFTPSKRQAKNN